MINKIVYMKISPDIPIEEISIKGLGELIISQNYNTLQRGKEAYQRDNNENLFDLYINDAYREGYQSKMWVNLEDAKAIVNALQSMINYIESE